MEAFGVLAAGAVDRLYGIARLVLRDTELAEDATQEALVRAQAICRRFATSTDLMPGCTG